MTQKMTRQASVEQARKLSGARLRRRIKLARRNRAAAEAVHTVDLDQNEEELNEAEHFPVNRENEHDEAVSTVDPLDVSPSLEAQYVAIRTSAAQQLRSSSGKNYARDVLRSQLSAMFVTSSESLHFFLAIIFLIAGWLKQGGRGRRAGSADMLKSLGIKSHKLDRPGPRIYLDLLKAFTPVPKHEQKRKRVQNRYSDYQNALAEAARQELDPETLLERLRTQGGIAALLDASPTRTSKKDRKGSAEQSGDRASSTGDRGQGRVSEEWEDAGDDDDAPTPKGSKGHSGFARLNVAASGRGGAGRDALRGQAAGTSSSVVFKVAKEARKTVQTGEGRYVAIVHLDSADRSMAEIELIDSLPHNDHATDEDALDAMIRGVRSSRLRC